MTDTLSGAASRAGLSTKNGSGLVLAALLGISDVLAIVLTPAPSRARTVLRRLF
jgi:hypothetical protein